MGQKPIKLEYENIDLYHENGNVVVRVARDIKAQQGITNYKLIETNLKNNERTVIFQSTNLSKTAIEFHKYILDQENTAFVQIRPEYSSFYDEIEISLKWFDIKDRTSDEPTIKYIANLLDGYDESYFIELENKHKNFKYDYYYIYTNEMVPQSSRSYRVFKEVAEYLDEFPECDQAVLPAIARIKEDKGFAFHAFDDNLTKEEIKRDLVRLCNMESDYKSAWTYESLKKAFQNQIFEIEQNIKQDYKSLKQKMGQSLEEKKKSYLNIYPPNQLIKLEDTGKQVETNEDLVKYLDNLLSKYGTGADNIKLKIHNDFIRHYIEGKPQNQKLKITTEEFYDLTNEFYITNAINSIKKRDRQTINELKKMLSNRITFEKYAEEYFANTRFKLMYDGRIIRFKQSVSKEFIVNEFIKIFVENPEFVKTIIGSKDYQTIQDTINNKNLTLDDLFEFYSNREKYLDLEPLSQNWINRTETWLYEFKSITGIENINEIEPNTFQGYFSELNKVLEGDYFPSWLSQRVIKTIKDNSVTTHWVKARIDFIERLFKKALLIYPQNAHLSNAIAYLKKIKQ